MSKKVYYDESCYVCSLEINAVRKKGESCGIEFVDISSSDFSSDGRDFESEMIGNFDGSDTEGIETFRKMYEKILALKEKAQTDEINIPISDINSLRSL